MKTLSLLFLLSACGGASFSVAPDEDAGTDTTPDLSDTAPDTASVADTQADAQIAETGPMCAVPTTPTLDGENGIHGGLQFHVTKDTVLTSFLFTGSGFQDVVTLSDTQCNAISSATVPGGLSYRYMPIEVNVHWLLHAGVSYQLTNMFGQTAYSSAVTTFPYVSGILFVEQGLVVCPLNGEKEGQIWTAFTNLTFCDPTGDL